MRHKTISLKVREEGPGAFSEHGAIPISFSTRSRIVVGDVKEAGSSKLSEQAIAPRFKDYDKNPEDRPSALAGRFDVSNWILIAVYADARRIGGAIVARDCPEYDLLEGRKDLAHIVDIRVHPDFRGFGIGRGIIKRCVLWARNNNCTELRVETQDINVGACRFYEACGFRLLSFEEHAYGPGPDEARLIWQLPI